MDGPAKRNIEDDMCICEGEEEFDEHNERNERNENNLDDMHLGIHRRRRRICLTKWTKSWFVNREGGLWVLGVRC